MLGVAGDLGLRGFSELVDEVNDVCDLLVFGGKDASSDLFEEGLEHVGVEGGEGERDGVDGFEGVFCEEKRGDFIGAGLDFDAELG